MTDTTDRAGEEFGRNLRLLRDARVSGLREASELEAAFRTLLQHEARRIENKYGADHPLHRRLVARAAASLERVRTLDVEREIYQVEIPAVADDGALVHGRIVDEDARAIGGLIACLVDGQGKPGEDRKESPNDSSGYFAIPLTAEDLGRLQRRRGVFLGILTSRGRLVYQEAKPLQLVKGARLFFTIELVRRELVEDGTVIRPPRPSKPPEEVKVPEVVGQRVEQAKAILKRVKLAVGEQKTEPDPDRAGLVLVQDPAAGAMVSKGTPVNLVVGVRTEVA